MARTIDKPYGTYSVAAAVVSGLCVKCPSCGKAGMITTDKANVYFRCTNCGHAKSIKRTEYRCDVENLCRQCGRYYRTHIFDRAKQQFSVLRVACPYCGHVMPGKVQKTPMAICIDRIRDGREPFFGLELWFLTSYRGKLIWALNREHLAYLIDYLSAELREEPERHHNTPRTQADQLPAFMKAAKNREGIVKCLRNIQR